jgi:hypothetical protein
VDAVEVHDEGDVQAGVLLEHAPQLPLDVRLRRPDTALRGDRRGHQGGREVRPRAADGP